MIDIKMLSLKNIMPPNLYKDRSVQPVATALDQELQTVTQQVAEATIYARIMALPKPIIDLLAWQFHVDFYEPVGLSLAKKREMVLRSIPWHRRKGTPSVVKEVVEIVYGPTEIKEWYGYGGAPYAFKLKTTMAEESTDKGRAQRVINAIFDTKNVRSWMEEIKFYYPDIVLPIKITHQNEIVGVVDNRHNYWNRGTAVVVYLDGEYDINGSFGLDALKPGPGWRTRQHHELDIMMFVEAYQHNWQSSYLDGTIDLDGGVDLSGWAPPKRIPCHMPQTWSGVDAHIPVKITYEIAAAGSVENRQKIKLKCSIDENHGAVALQHISDHRTSGMLNETFCLDGSHDLSGEYITDKHIKNYLTVSSINNQVRVDETQ